MSVLGMEEINEEELEDVMDTAEDIVEKMIEADRKREERGMGIPEPKRQKKADKKHERIQNRKTLELWHFRRGVPMNVVRSWTTAQLQAGYDEKQGQSSKQSQGAEPSGKIKAVEKQKVEGISEKRRAELQMKNKFDQAMKIVKDVYKQQTLEMSKKWLAQLKVTHKKPKIISWRLEEVKQANLPEGVVLYQIVVKRESGPLEIYKSLYAMIRRITREDLADMYSIGMQYPNVRHLSLHIELMRELGRIIEPESMLTAEQNLRITEVEVFESSSCYRIKYSDRSEEFYGLEFLRHSRNRLLKMKAAKIKGDDLELEQKLKYEIDRLLARR